jgi:hypothetical protein
MKIKTVNAKLIDSETFDREVNKALEEGYRITRQDVIPGGSYMSNMLYAQMVLPDPTPEPEQPDLLEALRTIRDHCAAMPTERCLTPDCPLSPWCDLYTADGISPMDWVIPEKEADK